MFELSSYSFIFSRYHDFYFFKYHFIMKYQLGLIKYVSWVGQFFAINAKIENIVFLYTLKV